MALYRAPGRALDIHTEADLTKAEIGDAWYNYDERYLKIKIHRSSARGAAWTVGGTTINVGTAMTGNPSGAGTLLAGIIWGGRNAYAYVTDGGENQSDEYDGTAWTAGPDLPYMVWENIAGIGTSTATFAAGGSSSPGYTNELCTEFDGTTWTAAAILQPGATNTGFLPMFSGGIQTAAWVAGGNIGTGIGDAMEHTAKTWEYDGTAWSDANADLVEGQGFSAGGTQSGSSGSSTAGIGAGAQWGAAFAFGDSGRNTSEEYNGTTWSMGGNLSQVRGGGWLVGSQVDCVMTGGTNLPGNNDAATTEEYDGTSWAVLDVAWAHTHDFVSGDLDLPRSDYRETGAGYPGSGTFNGTGFCVMNNSNFAVTGLVPAYTEEFSRTGYADGIDRTLNTWVRT